MRGSGLGTGEGRMFKTRLDQVPLAIEKYMLFRLATAKSPPASNM